MTGTPSANVPTPRANGNGCPSDECVVLGVRALFGCEDGVATKRILRNPTTCFGLSTLLVMNLISRLEPSHNDHHPYGSPEPDCGVPSEMIQRD